MAKIKAPNAQYTGVSASVAFVNGIGECADPVLLKWFTDHGYTVEQEAKPLEKLTKEELLVKAAELGLTIPEGSNKDAILKLVQDAVKE